MSLTGNYSGNVYRPIHQTLTGTGVTLIGSAVDQNSYTLSSWSFYNSTGSTVNCVLYWYDGTTQRAVWGRPVPANDTIIASDLPMRLRQGDEIRAQGANGINVTLCYTTNLPTQAAS